MRLLTLGLTYGALGLCLAALRLRWGPRRHRQADAVLLSLFWPLYAPFCFAGRGEGAADPLAGRLQRAEARAQALDRLLATPDFDAAAVQRRIDLLEGAGQAQAAAAARRVLGNIRRIQAVRRRYAEELAVVEALQHQLRTQRAVLALSGQPADLGELVAALEARVGAIEEVLADPVG